MQLAMCGIRFNQGAFSDREAFAFSFTQIGEALVKIKKQTRSEATVLLCTCDRIELWTLENKTSLFEPLCRGFALAPLACKQFSYGKEGLEGVPYLFELACGIHSPLFGEDQIISQLQEAIRISRLYGCTSPILEQLFKGAITVAKKVQRTLDLGVADKTVAVAVQNELQLRYGSLFGLPVLVIGSSALARLIAQKLLEHKASVVMTIRDMEKADFLLPPGVERALYDQRFSYFPKVSVVISATKGMEYTVTATQTGQVGLFFDLASPADIEPSVGNLPQTCLLTLSNLNCSLPEREKNLGKARALVSEGVDAFFFYLRSRENFATIQGMSDQAANDLLYRLHAPFDRLGMNGPELETFRLLLFETARKAFSHQLYKKNELSSQKAYVDLTRLLENAPALYPGDPEVTIEVVADLQKNHYRLKRLQLGTHSGTHIDSPNHIFEQGRTLDTYPIETFSAKAYVLDCRGQETIGRDLVDQVPLDVTCVLFLTGWGSFWGKAKYLENPPLPSVEAISFLLGRGVVLFGFDCVSCDLMEDASLPIHRKILSSQGLIIENLCNLETLASRCVDLVALPLLLKDSDGCPSRVYASYQT
jgi:glutamyl-tRNA reductase